MRQLVLKTLLTGLALTALAPAAWADFTPPAAPTGFVLDEAQILSSATETQLESQLSTLDQETSTQIVVVTLTDLQGYEPEQAALAIGRTWGVGQTGSDNGIVFLIVPTDHVARIEVGYGLEGAITDTQAYQILNEVALPAYKEGNYDQGTVDAVTDLETLARGETFTLPESSDGLGNLPLVVLFYLLPLLWGFLSFLSNSKAWWVGGVVGGIFGILFAGWLGLGLGLVGGLLLDYVLSTYFYQKLGLKNSRSRWWYLGGGGRWGGGSGGFGGGGFSGGGGSFGGGGASGRW